MSASAEGHKETVRRLVDTAMNGRDLSVVDELYSDRLAPKVRRALEQFRTGFPDWRQEIIQLVEEDDTVVARFRCTGTHLGEWRGLAPTGRTMRVDEVHFYRFAQGRIDSVWAIEDTWTRMSQLAGDDPALGPLGALG